MCSPLWACLYWLTAVGHSQLRRQRHSVRDGRFCHCRGDRLFPQFQLERSFHPDWTHVMWFRPYLTKLMGNLHNLAVNDLPRLGGSWASMLFLAGLLLGFRGAGRAAGALFFAHVPGHLHRGPGLGTNPAFGGISGDEFRKPDRIAGAAGIIYGVSFFFTFLDQMNWRWPSCVTLSWPSSWHCVACR